MLLSFYSLELLPLYLLIFLLLSFTSTMEGHLKFRNWKILMAPDVDKDDWKPSLRRRHKGAAFDGNGHDEETVEATMMDNSKNSSWVNPDTKRKDIDFPAVSTYSDCCEFDEPEEEKRLCLGSQKDELGGAKVPEIVEKIHKDEEGEETVGTMKIGIEKPEETGCEEHVEIENI
ncbi:hypothetical protein ZIOFF_021534 [Zingiber officinale]|uniref:Uncharacterized protein n=1 Tax=Zingiber officinale TaxID=94328 RepID=A0A8J5LGI8_ZINOF|nr:hypothetical protein ZIOFF_021534 [Zingiber officinale]